MRAMMALVLHLGGVGKCGRLIWEWSVQSQESGDPHNTNSPKGLKGPFDGLITGHVIGVNLSVVVLIT